MTGGPENGGMRVTTRDVFDAVQVLSGKVDDIAADLRAHSVLPVHPGALLTLNDHETRLRTQESRRFAPPAVWISVVALLVTIAGILGATLR